MKHLLQKQFRIGVTVLLMVCATLAQASAPMIKKQAPGFYRMLIGAFEITVLSDGTNSLQAGDTLTRTNSKDVEQFLARASLQEPIETSFNAFLINTGTKLVLIDTGAGTSMGPRNGHLLSNIAAAGYQPGEVDEVYITHMHGDHIGGLTSAGSPTFSNAVVRASKDEADYWLSANNLNAASADAKSGFQLAQDSLAPYIKSGRFRVFTDDTTLLPGIRALGTHGHTPGHTSYFIESNGIRLLVLGDIVHVAAVQFPKPSVTVHFDIDADAAARQREKVFSDAASAGYWVAGEHIAFPGIGHIRADGGGYVWNPANYSSIP